MALITFLTGFLGGCGLMVGLFRERWSEVNLIRLVLWIFWVMLLFAMLGFLITKIATLTGRFVAVSLGSFFLGIVYLFMAPATLRYWSRHRGVDVIGTNVLLFGFALAGFSFVFLFIAHSAQMGLLLQGMGLFVLPAVALKAYDSWLAIPAKKYKTWMYPLNDPVPRLLPVDTILVNMKFTAVPQPSQQQFDGYQVEYPSHVALGSLFHYFISFHNNHREYRKRPIQFMTDDRRALEWVLFKYGPGDRKIYLDTDKTLLENQISTGDAIYAASI